MSPKLSWLPSIFAVYRACRIPWDRYDKDEGTEHMFIDCDGYPIPNCQNLIFYVFYIYFWEEKLLLFIRILITFTLQYNIFTSFTILHPSPFTAIFYAFSQLVPVFWITNCNFCCTVPRFSDVPTPRNWSHPSVIAFLNLLTRWTGRGEHSGNLFFSNLREITRVRVIFM